jgi:hypothetical protein
MKKIFHHIRKQPEETKRHILHGTMIVMAVILLSSWVYTLGVGLSSPEVVIETKKDLKPFTAIKDNLVGGYYNILSPN